MNEKDSYFKLAPYYNSIMDHVDYTHWASFLHLYIIGFDISHQRPLETGAGTGSLAYCLRTEISENLILSDYSFPMIKQAGDEFPRLVIDMRQLPFKAESRDFLFSLYDAFNYLLTVTDVKSTLSEAYRVLDKGGHYFFDIITSIMCEDYFDEECSVEHLPGEILVRESNYHPIDKLQINSFTLFHEESSGLFSKTFHEHTQRVWELDELQEIWKKVGFELVQTSRDFTLDTDLSEALRINILLIKK